MRADITPDAEELLAVRVGMLETGQPWVIDFRVVPHWLNAGATQSGKSNLANAVITALAPQPVALIGFDLKDGVEFTPYAPRLLAITRAGSCRSAVIASPSRWMHDLGLRWLPFRGVRGARMGRADLAGAAYLELVSGVVQLRPEEAMLEAMLRGWRAQQTARGLREDTMVPRERTVRRFLAFTNEYPWNWGPSHVEEWTQSRGYEGNPEARPFVREELQRFLDCADAYRSSE